MKTIFRFRPEAEFYADEGCHIAELLNCDDDEECSIARARVAPGVTTQLHSLHGTVERYVVLEGQGEVKVGDLPPMPVSAMDVVRISAKVPQCITNVGATDLVFLCVCTPRFRQNNYLDLK